MKWILDRIGRLTAVRSQQSSSDHEPITPVDVHQTELVPNSEARASSSQPTETPLDSKLGVEDSLAFSFCFLLLEGDHKLPFVPKFRRRGDEGSPKERHPSPRPSVDRLDLQNF
jgi:hypothetical protein